MAPSSKGPYDGISAGKGYQHGTGFIQGTPIHSP